MTRHAVCNDGVVLDDQHFCHRRTIMGRDDDFG
jgi:hypothetical protein